MLLCVARGWLREFTHQIFCRLWVPAIKFLFIASLLPTVTAVAQPLAEQSAVQQSVAELSAQEIARRITEMRTPLDGQTRQINWYTAEAVGQFYEQRHYQLAWIEPSLRQQLLDAIESLSLDGLTPDDYFFTSLQNMQRASAISPDTDINAMVDRDLLATEAYLRALYHLFNGKVDPDGWRPQWFFELNQIAPTTQVEHLIDAVNTGKIADTFAEMRPKHMIYQSLQAGLRRYQELNAHGGWPALTTRDTLKPGMTDPQIALLRQRLLISGEYKTPPPGTIVTVTPLSSSSSSASSASSSSSVEDDASTASSNSSASISLSSASESSSSSSVAPVDPNEVYDDLLVAAVKRFQQEQYLDADGVVGSATRTAINISVQARVDQIRVNLDRARWLLHNVPDDLLLVDVAGFKVTLFKSRQPIWQSRVQVGMSYRTSPIFKSEINYITFNPTWTVPPTILKNDILPKLRSDLTYLSKNNIRVFNNLGKELDPKTIDWNNPGNVTLRQDAGDKAALGKVVIRFPNPHSVYLHDTPHQELFNKTQRAFSSGCIRVERALELVELLLSETPNWDKTAIDKVLATGRTLNIPLAKRIPILLAYWTVDATSEDKLAFKPDIYLRDTQVLKALNAKK